MGGSNLLEIRKLVGIRQCGFINDKDHCVLGDVLDFMKGKP